MKPELIQSFESFNQSIDKLNLMDELLDSSIKTKLLEIEDLNYGADLRQKGSEVFKMWLEDLLDRNVNSMADLVSNGLSYVIDDQDLTFSIKQEPKYNKISMSFLMTQDGHEGNPMLSYGGGAVLVASLILRLAIMARLNMANLLILDEPLNALAAKYIGNAGAFIRQLCEKTGINILMVTHVESFLDYAHTAYEASSVVVGEKDGHSVSCLKLVPYEVSRTPSL
jgi:DNA repair exonuclease SbcCD ATPase subunit